MTVHQANKWTPLILNTHWNMNKLFTEMTDVPDAETPKILLEKLAKKYQIWDLVQTWYKESTGKNGPFIRDLTTLILKYCKTPLEATGIQGETHIYSHNQYLWIYSRNWSKRHCFDETRFRYKSRFITLDTSIDSLFKNGVSSISIKPVFSRCNTLKHRFQWSFGLAQCTNKQAMDTLLDWTNTSGRNSMSSLLAYKCLTGDYPYTPWKINGILNLYWFEMKYRASGTDGVFFYGWRNVKLSKFIDKNRTLSNDETNRKFEILLAKGGNGQIRLDDWLIDGKYDTNNESSWYFWCIVHLCSCKTNKLPVGVVLQLSCNY